MLTTLNVVTPQTQNKIEKLFRRLRKNTITQYCRQFGNLKIMCVDYTCFNGDINWYKLDEIIGPQRRCLLCDKGLALPKELGYKRFCDIQYKKRLCKNLATKLVMKCSRKLKVAVVDYDAVHTEFVKYLIKYTDDLVVITKNTDIYTQVADDLLEQTGAVLTISKSDYAQCRCELIVKLSKTDKVDVGENNALCLSVFEEQETKYTLNIFDYAVALPLQFEQLCPQYIDKTYFAGALYSECNVYRLGSLVPQLCVSARGAYTQSELEKLLNNMDAKT